MYNVFAYGSNMAVARIRARVESAVAVSTGYVTHRRLEFHKWGIDGSGKADASYTGQSSDHIWGVVYSLSTDDHVVLSDYEQGYDKQEVVVTGNGTSFSAIIYVARAEAIGAVLKPFSWYHDFVIHGARQHRLPADYLSKLQTVETMVDPNRERHDRNMKLIGG